MDRVQGDCDWRSIHGGSATVRTRQSSSTRCLWCTGARCGCLGMKRGSLETSPVIARSDGCGWVARSGSGGDLSSSKSEFLCKRNPKDGREWMRLPTPFIGQRMEERWYRGGKTVDCEWSYSMPPLQGERRKGQCPFQKGKGACKAALGSRAEGRPEDAAARQCAARAGGRSLAASELTWGGRQSVGPIGMKCCLHQILLWRLQFK
jgi:hypothetical protein